MLIRAAQADRFQFHDLTIRELGDVANGVTSATRVDVRPHEHHPYSYSSRSDRLFVMLEGALRFDVDGIAYVARAADAVLVRKGLLYDYFDCQGKPARMLVVSAPPADPSSEHTLPDLLRPHDVILRGDRVMLRPMTEDDWRIVCAWNADPEVLRWADGTDTEPRTPEETKPIYRGVSRFAYVFIIEFDGEPIGDCWLQKLNLPEIRDRFPGRDMRRIDIAIGRKDLWGKGLGSDAIATLVRFAFERERADGIYYAVSPGNPRSRRAAAKAGFQALEGHEGLIAWRDPLARR
jgi:RimJ/RimL family protein N-acetyltransferase